MISESKEDGCRMTIQTRETRRAEIQMRSWKSNTGYTKRNALQMTKESRVDEHDGYLQ